MSVDEKNSGTRGSSSRLGQHLQVLGLEKGGPLDAKALEHERRMIDAIDAPPLRFSEEPAAPVVLRPRFWELLMGRGGFGVALAFAAALTLFVMTRNETATETPQWQAKGDSHVEVYVESVGQVQKLVPGATLKNGDKVRAEVAAGRDLEAFLGVVGRESQLLSERDAVWNSRLRVGVGDKRYFPGSIELVGASEGETLVVVMCAVPNTVSWDDVLLVMTGKGKIDGCTQQSVKLR